jgi:hypothetical protein
VNILVVVRVRVRASPRVMVRVCIVALRRYKGECSTR